MRLQVAVVLVTLAGVFLACDALRTRRRLKSQCPSPSRVNVRLRFRRYNMFRGGCEVIGNGRDSCRGRMSCCENFQGDYLCVRTQVFQPRYRSALATNTDFPPLPPMQELMLNDVENSNLLCPTPFSLDAPCFQDLKSRMCIGDNDCSLGRICCEDPCAPHRFASKICLEPVKAQLPAVAHPPSVDPSLKENPDTRAAESPRVPTSAISKAPETHTTDSAADFQHPNCPKPEKQCDADGTQCAVACPSYDETYVPCDSKTPCSNGRMCCADPCPNSPLKLCFPDTKNQ